MWSIWSIAQTVRSRPSFVRYEQRVRIRDDHPPPSGVPELVQTRASDALAEFASRRHVPKIRRTRWIVITVLMLLSAPLALVA